MGQRLLEAPIGGCLAVPPTAELSLAPTTYGICQCCHGPSAPGYRTCWSCRLVRRQLAAPVPPVVPVFLFGLGSPVHRALVGYKAGVASSGRAARAEALGRVLGRFLVAHTACLLGGGSAAIVVPVPSSIGGRKSWYGRHPIGQLCERAVREVPRLSAVEILCPGPRPARRLDASLHGYHVVPGSGIGGRTAIVVDDMFVSGSRSLSAAAALHAAGASVAAVVPLGRLVRPDHSEATAAFWQARQLEPFDPGCCAVCATSTRRHGAIAWPGPGMAVSERLAA
jgi:predicted amidophosphoribosyltransferase